MSKRRESSTGIFLYRNRDLTQDYGFLVFSRLTVMTYVPSGAKVFSHPHIKKQKVHKYLLDCCL